MTLPLGDGLDWPEQAATELSEHLERFDAVVLGPGMGRGQRAADLLQGYLELDHPPTVFDADALFHLAGRLDSGPALKDHSVLTPHPGEMARLCRVSTTEIQMDRLVWNRRLADQTGAVSLLKGAGSVLAAPGQPNYISPFSQPTLAVGGSGDVLSGVIGSLMARGVPPLQAACLGVYWHGLAGELLEHEYPQRGNLAGEIASALPRVVSTRAAPGKNL
jgi:NAD(P)H-hydrate epimerase